MARAGCYLLETSVMHCQYTAVDANGLQKQSEFKRERRLLGWSWRACMQLRLPGKRRRRGRLGPDTSNSGAGMGSSLGTHAEKYVPQKWHC